MSAAEAALLQSFSKAAAAGAPKASVSLPPYLPNDLDPRGFGASLELQDQALTNLLSLIFGAFCNQLLNNPQVQRFLDTFLSLAPRPYEGEGRDEEDGLLPSVAQASRQVTKKVLLVYLRLAGSDREEGASALLGGEASNKAFANLLWTRRVLDLPKVLDLCSLYGYTNPGLVDRLVLWVCERQGEALREDLSRALPSIMKAVQEVGRGLQGEALPGSSGDGDDDDEDDDEGARRADLMQYIVDITAALSALTRAKADVVPVLSAAGKAFLGPDGLLGELAVLYGQVMDRVVEADDDLRRTCALARKLIVGLSSSRLGHAMSWLREERQAAKREEGWELLYTALGKMAGEDTAAGESRDLVRDLCQRCDLVRQIKGLDGKVDKFGLEYLTKIIEARGAKSSSGQGGRSRRKRSLRPTRTGAHDDDLAGAEGRGFKKNLSDPTVRATDPELIDQVKAILPDLGEGFIAACLAVLGGPDMVVSTLLEGGPLPYPLELLDRGLGTAWRKREGADRGDGGEDKAFVAIQKQYIRHMEREQEDRNYLMQEYDDDYDDQYDGWGIQEGAAPATSGRTDLEGIKKFNRMLREREEEDAFWDSLRNTNRPAPRKEGEEEDEDGEEGGGGGGKTGDGGEGKAQGGGQAADGPAAGGGDGNRGRRGGGGGGRGRGRGRGGGGGGDGAAMSAIQKRRKDQNKARIGNHNRRAGAARKQARGFGGFPSAPT